MKRLTVLFALLTLTLTACDSPLQYRLQNDSSQTLLTWPVWDDDCEAPSGPAERHGAEQVYAHEAFDYDSVYSGNDDPPRCVVVSTTQHQAVLLSPYEESKTYVVQDPLTPGVTISGTGHVSQQTNWSLIVTGIVFLFVIGSGLFLLIRWAWRGANSQRS